MHKKRQRQNASSCRSNNQIKSYAVWLRIQAITRESDGAPTQRMTLNGSSTSAKGRYAQKSEAVHESRLHGRGLHPAPIAHCRGLCRLPPQQVNV